MDNKDKVWLDFIKNEIKNNKSIYNKGQLKKSYDYISGKYSIDRESLHKLIQELKIETVKSKINDIIENNTVQEITKKSFNIINRDPGNVLIISDTHLPFEKEGVLDFCIDIKNKYNCKTIVHIGDEIDNCAISQYSSDPDGLSAGSEAFKAAIKIKDWYKAFPNVNVCIGNHTNRMFRLAHLSGIPKRMLKTYEQMWEAPEGWSWSESFDIQNVHYSHGNGMSGNSAAIKKAIQLRKSCVIGHIHTEAGIQWNVSSVDKLFGMQVGCLIDDKAYAFAYAKDNVKKSILSVGVVVENGNLPILELMKL
jgi:predicted phosphodiesterase